MWISSAADLFKRVLVRCFRRQYWAPEIASIVLAIMNVCILCAILHANDNQPIWTGSITLNAIASIFITILFALLSAVINTCTSQLRWVHFKTPRSLADFEQLDKVSRGPGGWNGLRLLLSLKNGAAAPFAVLLGILMFSIGPLTQQILQLDQRQVITKGNALLPTARQVVLRNTSKYEDQRWSDIWNATFSSAIELGLFNDPTQPISVQPVCIDDAGRSNCSWSGYPTFEYQTACRDVTEQLTFAHSDTVAAAFDNLTKSFPLPAIMLSNMTYISLDALLKDTLALNELLVPSWQSAPSSGVSLSNKTRGIFSDFNFVVVNTTSLPYSPSYFGGPMGNPTDLSASQKFQIISASGSLAAHQTTRSDGKTSTWGRANGTLRYKNTHAWECDLALVLQPYNATYIDGKLVETPTSLPVRHENPGMQGQRNNSRGDSPTRLIYSWQGAEYPVDLHSLFFVQYLLQEMLPGFSHSTNSPNEESSIANGTFYPGPGVPVKEPHRLSRSHASQLLNRITANTTNLAGGVLPTSVPQVIENIAHSITKLIRNIHSIPAVGANFDTKTVYRITWCWLAIPLSLTVACAVLIGITAYMTRKAGLPVWTDSALAVMVHGIDTETRSELFHMREVEELAARSEEIEVFFDKTNLSLRQPSQQNGSKKENDGPGRSNDSI